PASSVPVGEQLPARTKGRQDVTLEILAVPVVESRFVEDEEPGVDPMVGEDRLFPEVANLTLGVDIERPVLRRERDRGECCRPDVRAVEPGEGVEVDVRQAVGVCREEGAVEVLATPQYATTRVGVLAGVEDLDVPLRRE